MSVVEIICCHKNAIGTLKVFGEDIQFVGCDAIVSIPQ